MVQHLELTLDNGKVEKLTFNVNFLIHLGNVVDENGKRANMDETLKEILTLLSLGDKLSLSGFADMAGKLPPFVLAAINAGLEFNGKQPDCTLEHARMVVKSLGSIEDVGKIIALITASTFPQGLPKEDGKKKEAVKKTAPRGKK